MYNQRKNNNSIYSVKLYDMMNNMIIGKMSNWATSNFTNINHPWVLAFRWILLFYTVFITFQINMRKNRKHHIRSAKCLVPWGVEKIFQSACAFFLVSLYFSNISISIYQRNLNNSWSNVEHLIPLNYTVYFFHYFFFFKYRIF